MESMNLILSKLEAIEARMTRYEDHLNGPSRINPLPNPPSVSYAEMVTRPAYQEPVQGSRVFVRGGRGSIRPNVNQNGGRIPHGGHPMGPRPHGNRPLANHPPRPLLNPARPPPTHQRRDQQRTHYPRTQSSEPSQNPNFPEIGRASC